MNNKKLKMDEKKYKLLKENYHDVLDRLEFIVENGVPCEFWDSGYYEEEVITENKNYNIKPVEKRPKDILPEDAQFYDYEEEDDYDF